MATIDKNSRNYILQLVKENDLKSVLAFCQGYGFDTNSYLSPVTYNNGQLAIRYRNETKYYTL